MRPMARRRTGRLLLLLLTTLLALAVGPAAHAWAGGVASIEGVRVGAGEVSPGQYKLGAWTPVFVDLQGQEGAFRGFVEVTAPDDDGLPTSARFPAYVEAGQGRTVVGYARPGMRRMEVEVRLLDERGEPVPAAARAAVRVEADPLGPNTRLVLMAGQPGGLVDLLRLEKYLSDTAIFPELVVAPLRDFPGAAYGLDGVDALVIATGDERTMSRLRAGAARTVKAWVARGGHLVVAQGPNWQETAELLGDVLPAVLDGPVRLPDPDAIESFAGGRGRGIAGSLMATRLVGLAERGAIPLAATPLTPVVVRGPHGLGRVTLVGIDTQGEPFASWSERRQFWDRVLDLRPPADEGEFWAGAGMGRGAIIQSAAPELGARLHRSLESFPGLRIIPFGWVAFFVFVYILLIGPVDYLFLRKVVKRMELTWITFPLIVVGVSVLAYLGAHAVKGRDLRVNKVDLVDFDQSTGQVRGQSWLTVFSPQNRDYGVRLEPSGPDFDPSGGGLDLAEQTAGAFASPDPQLGGLGRVTLGQAGYRYGPDGSVSEVRGVRIPIWSTKSFTGRWSGTADRPVVEADLAPTGGDRLAGSVRNLTGRTLSNAQLYYGRNVYSLGPIRPGGIARVDPGRAEATSRYLGRLARQMQSNASRIEMESLMAQSEGGEDPTARRTVDGRADILRAAMFHAALGERGGLIPGRSLRYLDLYPQSSELRRPILVAEVDAPAAALTLEGAPAEPETAQTTLLRVILDLDDPRGVDPR